MVIKIFYFFIALFSVVMVLIMVQNPYIATLSRANLEIADMQMRDVSDYEITQSGINSNYRAKIWQKFGDKNDFLDFYGVVLDRNYTHEISSKNGYLKDNILLLSKNAVYKNDKNITFSSDEIIFDMKSKIVRSKVPFIATLNDNNISGKIISYDTKNGIIRAKFVDAWLKFDE